jgi:hypothetical protein
MHPPSALLTLLISYFQKLNHHDFNGLSTVVQQLLGKKQIPWANPALGLTVSEFFRSL